MGLYGELLAIDQLFGSTVTQIQMANRDLDQVPAAKIADRKTVVLAALAGKSPALHGHPFADQACRRRITPRLEQPAPQAKQDQHP